MVKVAALVMLFTLAACVQSMAGTTGVMNGYVRDHTGQPAADVLVTVVSPSETKQTYTDKRGFFVFLSLSPDVYSVRAEKAGTSNAYAIGARIDSDQTTFLTFRFGLYRNCPSYTRVSVAANQGNEPFESLDVRRLEQYPPNVAPPILLTSVPARGFSCL